MRNRLADLWKQAWYLLLCILMLLTRLWRPGMLPSFPDEMNLLYWSLRMVRNGEWLWLSNNWR